MIGWKSVHISDKISFSDKIAEIATVQIWLECETQESDAGIQNIWVYTNLKHI